MAPKVKVQLEVPPPQERESLGLSPAALAKRSTYKPERWGPTKHPLMLHYDPWCDPFKPKIIRYTDITKAHNSLKQIISPTPLTKANGSDDFQMNLYFKRETVHQTGSFYERAAVYVLKRLTKKQRQNGIYTASFGSWAVSLVYHAKKMGIPVKAYIPVSCHANYVQHFFQYGDSVVRAGHNLDECRKLAIENMRENGVADCYINGYDHPDVIAASGTIAIEILEQCPDVDAILVPINGGGLIAAIATVIKTMKPGTLVYGMEPDRHNYMFRSMEAGKPYFMKDNKNITHIGVNAFHTAQPLIDKIVLVDDDCIARALLYFVEEERFIVENKSTTALAALFHEPNILPELRDKTVVCLITGGFIDYTLFPRTLARGKSVAGRMVTLKVAIPIHRTDVLDRVLTTIKRLGCSIQGHEIEHTWFEARDMGKYNMTIECETRDHKHASLFKNVMASLYPNMIEFSNFTCTEHSSCPCYPKMWPSL